jgi:mono/diheme cytochrome c family protein
MSRSLLCAVVVCAVVVCAGASRQADAADRQVERGKYLVRVISCSDCHTPGGLLGKPDMKRFLGGSEVGFALPDLGVFYGSNLTPDTATGLGNWTVEEIATAIRTGIRPDGRKLAPVMPVALLWPPDPGRRIGDRCLSQDAAPGPQQDRRPVRPKREADLVCDDSNAG